MGEGQPRDKTIAVFSREDGEWSFDEFVAMILKRAGDDRPHLIVEAENDYDSGWSFSITIQRKETPEEVRERVAGEQKLAATVREYREDQERRTLAALLAKYGPPSA